MILLICQETGLLVNTKVLMILTFFKAFALQMHKIAWARMKVRPSILNVSLEKSGIVTPLAPRQRRRVHSIRILTLAVVRLQILTLLVFRFGVLRQLTKLADQNWDSVM